MSKLLVQLLAGGMLVVVALEVFGITRLAPTARPALLITLCLALGGCLGEQYLFTRDYGRTQADIDRATCADARRIFATGQGLGRQWQPVELGQPSMHAPPPQPWRVMNLYLSRMSTEKGGETYLLRAGGWVDDDVYGNIECSAGTR